MTDKIRVDALDLTLGEMADATEAAGENVDVPGGSFRQMAGMAWVVKRRTDPTFTFEDALALKMSDIDIAEADPPEARGGDTGVTPPP